MSFKNDNFSDIYNKSTPPPKVKVRNPFDRALIERLHKPICSPGMCKIYKKKNRGSFRWEIDQTCTLVPADIVVCSSQFEPSPDPALEKIAEEANEKFFSQEMVMPSPLESSKKVKPLIASFESSVQTTTSIESVHTKETKDVSAQTMLTFPPILPPEIEKILEPYCNYTEENDIFGEYEITANGSLRRKLFFEEQSDKDYYDSEQTDDEIHVEQRPPSNCESHTPVVFSPDELSNDFVSRGMKRTFGTPLQNRQSRNKPRNKILDVVDFGEPCFSPIEFQTPKRCENSTTSSSLASASISPVTKAISSDEEKNNLTSPECEAMATCLDCFDSEATGDKKCFCKSTPNKSSLMRSTSLKDSPHKSRRGSLLREKRSLSMSSLHRSRSVQKLDFSMDMSIDVSMHNSFHTNSESSPLEKESRTWSIEEDPSIQHLVKIESLKNKSDVQSSTKIHNIYTLDETPIKGSKRNNVLAHEISKMRNIRVSPEKMSLDSSLDNFDIPPTMEDRKIDFNKVDLKFLTENISQVEYNCTKVTNDTTTSFKRVDSGFNENTFNVNASSYYESAIKPSELTVTNASKCETKTALREISNVNWMRVDSGFKDDTSGDSMQFYPETSARKVISEFQKFHDKENMEDFDKLFQAPIRAETMSMSDIFNDDMTFNCNFSSTPSKNKNRKATS
ncbi:protein aurora borealis [Aricia agestis]|uniref:protein aurora borealis n=1 Tax=Aricia agestis TaxID=91739 RepID=UPI001C20A727|nr:protein aurora borealis [Aricia agestis]XP_041976545.1 protein aurora borealis [Aricia agestis]